jgi:hypothetical protein
MRPLAALAGTLLALSLPAAASADTITVSFTGTVSFVAADLASGFDVGDPVTGTFQYSTNLTDLLPGNPNLGIYLGATNFSFDFGGYVASAVAPGSAVQIDNDAIGTGTFDRFIGSKTCNGTCTAANVGAFSLSGITFLLSGASTIFPDDSLPASLELTDFSQRSASLAFTNGSIGPQVSALVESLTITVTAPEPSALVLLAALAGAVAVARVRAA